MTNVSNISRDVNRLRPQDVNELLARKEISDVGFVAFDPVAAASFAKSCAFDVCAQNGLRILVPVAWRHVSVRENCFSGAGLLHG